MRYAVQTAALAILLVLVSAAGYETAVALGWISVGTEPGEGARYEGFVMVSAALAMLAAVVVALVAATRPHWWNVPAAPFAVAAAVLMVAHYYTFDTYYLPTLTRYSDSGLFSSTWVYSLALAGALASLLVRVRPLIGLLGTAVVIPFCLFTIVFAGLGK